MAVHFRFFSSKQFESICVSGDSIALVGLKDAIADRLLPGILEGKRRVKEPFDFRVYDAETEEEIVGADSKIWKHSRVLVKRVPAFLLQQRAAGDRLRVEEVQNCRRPCVQGDSSPDISLASRQKEDAIRGEEVESRAVRNKKVDRVVRQSGVVRVGNLPVPSAKVPDTRVQTSVGPYKAEVAQPTAAPCAMEMPSELICLLCRNIMKDPVLIRCCCNSFCENCIKVVLVEQKKCPKCESTKCRESDLLPNRHLTTMIEVFRRNNVSASSSVGSNGPSSLSSEQSLKMETADRKVMSIITSTNSHSRASQPTLSNISVDRKPCAQPCGSQSSSLAKSSVISTCESAGGSSGCTPTSLVKRKPLVLLLNGGKKACNAQCSQVFRSSSVHNDSLDSLVPSSIMQEDRMRVIHT